MSSRIWRLKLRLSQGLFELFEYFWLLLWVSKTISFTLGGNEWQIRFDRRCIRLGLSWIWGGFQMKIFTGTNRAEQSATSFAYKQRRLYYSLGKIILFAFEFSCMHILWCMEIGEQPEGNVYSHSTNTQCSPGGDGHSPLWSPMLLFLVSSCWFEVWIMYRLFHYYLLQNLEQIFPEQSANFSTKNWLHCLLVLFLAPYSRKKQLFRQNWQGES